MRLTYSERPKFSQGNFSSPAMERFKVRKLEKAIKKDEQVNIEGDISFSFAFKFLLAFLGTGITFLTLIVILSVLSTGQF